MISHTVSNFVQLTSTLIKSYYCCAYFLCHYQYYYYKVAAPRCPSKTEPNPLCHYCLLLVYFPSLFDCTSIDAGSKWKIMLLLLLLICLCAISTCIEIKFPLLYTYDVNWLLINILIFHSDVWKHLFCFLIGCIQQFHWLIILLNNFSNL